MICRLNFKVISAWMRYGAIRRASGPVVVSCLCIGAGIGSFAYGQQSTPRTELQNSIATTDSPDNGNAANGIDAWIEQLGHTNPNVRDNAARQLEQAGLAAFERLRLGTQHRNAEISEAAQYLLNSMHVAWTLQTDSPDVQRLLKDYNRRDPLGRKAVMQRLSEIETDDARMALIRLSRYEPSEVLAKTAALLLLDTTVDKTRDIDEQKLSEIIEAGLGSGDRVSTKWLRSYANSVKSASFDFADWQTYSSAERMLLESNSAATNRETIKHLYRWIVHRLTKLARQQEALSLIPSMLELIPQGSTDLKSEMASLLDADLPDGVRAIYERNKVVIDGSPYLKYLAAESLELLGRSEEAEAAAEEAFKLPRADSRFIPQDKKAESEAVQRKLVASFLIERGRFAWGEREMTQALAVKPTPRTEYYIRDDLAESYWSDGKNEKAAEVWRMMLERIKTDAQAQSKLEMERDNSFSFQRNADGKYHFFAGLAATDRGDHQTARKELIIALGYVDNNPDYVIALGRVLDDDAAAKQTFDDALNAMIETYRQNIIEEEARRLATPDQQRRLQPKEPIASEYNQLAWLLAGVGRMPREAIRLSERSLSLSPDEPIFLDTLARCHFAAGNLEEAVKHQTRAVKLAPFERQMRRQLAEFEAALAKSKN